MKKKIILAFILAMLFSGYEHHIYKYSNESQQEYYNRIVKLCTQQNEITIELLSGKLIQGKELTISPDFTSFYEIDSQNNITIKTNEIKTIRFTEEDRGTLDGILAGVSVGGGVGLLLCSLNINRSAEQIGGFYTLAASLLGGTAVGLIYGWFNPSITIIEPN